MFCPNCGHEESATADFCSECGTALPDTGGSESGGDEEPARAATAGEAAAPEPEDSGRRLSRLAGIGGGALAAVSVFLPWVTAKAGGFSGTGMDTEVGPLVLVGAAVVVLTAGGAWGRGLGWLSMLVSGVAGAGVAVVAMFTRTMLAETATFSTVQVKGQRVPVAAVEPATGVTLAMIGGGLAAVAALAGIVSTALD